MMSKFVLAALVLTSLNAFAGDFYECGGFAGVDEYRVGIDLKKGKAGFFDNDTTSILKLTDTKFLESLPPQTLMIFEGKEASYSGDLVLYFNVTTLTATLTAISPSGRSNSIGEATCRETREPWDLE